MRRSHRLGHHQSSSAQEPLCAVFLRWMPRVRPWSVLDRFMATEGLQRVCPCYSDRDTPKDPTLNQTLGHYSMLPTTLKELGIVGIFLATGAALFCLGNIASPHREGGRRLVLLGFGIGSGFVGWFVVRGLWTEFHSFQYPEGLLFSIGCLMLAFATLLVGVSLLGSNRRVNEIFDAVLGGL